jgi:hypothetical protein
MQPGNKERTEALMAKYNYTHNSRQYKTNIVQVPAGYNLLFPPGASLKRMPLKSVHVIINFMKKELYLLVVFGI